MQIIFVSCVVIMNLVIFSKRIRKNFWQYSI